MKTEKLACPLTVWLVQGGDAPAFVFSRSPLSALKVYKENFPEAQVISVEPWLKLKESDSE